MHGSVSTPHPPKARQGSIRGAVYGLLATLLLSLGVTSNNAAFGKNTDGETKALVDVVGRVRHWQDSIVSLWVRIETRHLNTRPNDVVTSISAAKEKKRYYSMWHGPEALKNNDTRTYTQFFDGTEFILYTHFYQRYETTARYANEDYLWKVQRTAFFECLGWWPPDDDSPPPKLNGEPDFWPDILSDQRLTLVGASEIAGHQCQILEIPGVVRVVVDSELGILRRREQLRGISSDDRSPWGIYELYDYEEINGVWLPRTIERHVPDRDFHVRHKIVDYQVNNVPDSTFTLDPPPGTMIYNRDTGEMTAVSGGLDCMERILTSVRNRLPANETQNALHVRDWLLMGSCFLVGCYLGMRLPTISPVSRLYRLGAIGIAGARRTEPVTSPKLGERGSKKHSG